MLDEYETITGRHLPGVITGKPVPLFGSLGRGDATARGGWIGLTARHTRADLVRYAIRKGYAATTAF